MTSTNLVVRPHFNLKICEKSPSPLQKVLENKNTTHLKIPSNKHQNSHIFRILFEYGRRWIIYILLKV